MKLIIAEKPSVAQDIASALKVSTKKNGYFESQEYKISWCFGHLISLSPPEKYDQKYKKWCFENLPIIPNNFKTEIITEKEKQFYILKDLMHQCDEIICATDAGREGELIFRLVYKQANCSKKFKRLWISSMTEEAILQGMKNLKNGDHYDSLFWSAFSRARADWLIGMNASQLFSLKYNQKFSCGRVQTPTLNLIVKRHQEIINFKPEDYYIIKCFFDGFESTWFNDNGNKIKDKKEADHIKNKCNLLSGKIIKLETKEKKIDRPLLFDLTELQREANRRFGYTAQETLNIAQNLYEKHKLITYPRTDSRYLTSDLKSSIEKILVSINKNIKSSKIDELIKNGINIDFQVICDEKVTDHHAIIPTIKIETYDLSSLSNEEYNILKLITTRFIVILAQKHIFHETTCIIEIKNESFKSIGKTIIQDGWKAIENHFLKEKEEKKEKDQNLPLLKLGEILSQVKEIEVLAKKTTPKDKYTEATLLTAMENASEHVDDDLKEYMKEKGLGTPATRASIIERLLSMKYIERSAKNIIPTPFGIQFIDIIPEVLKNPDLTANWEFRLNQIYHQKEDPNKFMSDIEKFISELIVNNKENKNNITIESKQEKETIGKCPICGKSIYENQKSFYCEGYKYEPKCQFSIWIENKFLDKKITKAMAKSFLSKGFANIKNNGLDIKIVMTINDNNQPNFYFEKKEIGRCPRCNQSILEGSNSFYCENNKECGFIIYKENKFFTNRGIIITSKIITEILKNKKFEARNIKSSTGKSYNAMFLLEDSNEGFVNFKMEFLN